MKNESGDNQHAAPISNGAFVSRVIYIALATNKIGIVSDRKKALAMVLECAVLVVSRLRFT